MSISSSTDYYRIRGGLERRLKGLLRRTRAFVCKITGASIGQRCSFGKSISFTYGWRTSIGTDCVIDDFVEFKTPTGFDKKIQYNIIVGDNTFIGRGSIIDSNLSVSIGRAVLIAPFCFITDTVHDFNDAITPIYAQGWLYKPVFIEDNVWIGAHTVVVAGVRIGHGSVIGANSTVTRDIPPNSVAYGNPARVIKTRGQ